MRAFVELGLDSRFCSRKVTIGKIAEFRSVPDSAGAFLNCTDIRGVAALSRSRIVALLTLMVVVGGGCSERLPSLPLALAPEVSPLDIPYSRFYPDADSVELEQLGKISIERERRALSARSDNKLPTAHFLAISGGGDNGAFGAGLMCGWSVRGDRPEFRLVTGVSTGALSAPFVFLGQEYDSALEQVYTHTSAADVFFPRNKVIAAVAADAVTDTTPLRSMVDRFVDQRMVQRIAEEYGRGRLLLIMTTNLDQGRPVIWNLGAIAESRHPRSRELIIDILMASSAIPGLFPPVMIAVTHGGKEFHEMHVDGGTTAQTFLYPPNFRLGKLGRQKGVDRNRIAYIIRNGRWFRDEAEVPRQTLSVAAQAASTMIAANGTNDAFRIYLTTRRDGVAYNLAYIGDDFAEPYAGPFDQAYMIKLFSYGREQGLKGSAWRKSPPGFEN